jgi:phage gpG-like protein
VPQSKFNLQAVMQKVEQTKRVLPKQVANMTQNYFVLSWNKQGFDNKNWAEVNRRIPGTPEFRYPKTKGLSRRTKPILVQSGALRRKVANSVVAASWNDIRLVVDLPYAAIQNEGSNHNPKKGEHSQHGLYIPARPFIGQTKELSKMQVEMIEKYFDKIWK